MILLALLLAALSLGASLALAGRLRVLSERLTVLERRPSVQEGLNPLAAPSPLAGVRVALNVRQDYPNPVFVNLLKEALLREEALLEEERPDVRIAGEIVGNGYADVYYRADLAASVGDDVLFVLTERPPHGDRPANLALETGQRLKVEWAKRERQSALRELAGP